MTLPAPYYADDLVTVFHGDCVRVMAELPEASVDAIVTDPPYGLEFMGVAWDSFGDRPKGKARPRNEWGDFGSREHARSATEAPAIHRRKSLAFQKFSEAWTVQALRVLRPGGHLLAFGGTRTAHRMAVAIEDAGFEIRDTLAWMYGSGFPKGQSQLKPSYEPIALARKPLAAGSVAANVLACGTGALNVDGCRIDHQGAGVGRPASYSTQKHEGWQRPWNADARARAAWSARRDEADVRAQALGRWPANVVLDGEAAALLDAATGPQRSGGTPPRRFADKTRNTWSTFNGEENPNGIGASEGAVSRFFYTAKASPTERQGVTHPTVKPVALMRWLCRLVTPPGGVVLDCFAGSGTTRLAALAEGFRVVLIEQSAEYLEQLCGRAAQTALPLGEEATG